MRLYLLLLAVMAGILGFQQSACAADAANDRQSRLAVAARKTAKEESLKQGLPAEEVMKLLGKPDEISPMKAPTGKAEVWTYRSRQELSRERFEVASRPITTLVRDRDGRERQVVIGQEPIFGTQKRVLVRTYQVLMFNDHLLNDKVVAEEVRETE